MQKCPACGYHLRGNNFGPQMNKILKSRNRKTVKTLNRIASIVMSNVPSETRLNYYQFLHGTKDVEDNVLDYSIEKYYQEKHFHNGKGFAYLRSICLNRDKNIDTIRKNERNRLGSVPPNYNEEE